METVIEKPVQSGWDKSKLIIKGGIIAVLALFMMIPMAFVENLVKEREERQREATTEINSKWAGPQNITGPVIGVPYLKKDPADTTGKASPERHIAWFLPENLLVNASVEPKEKHRGIYKVMLYESKVAMSGNFKAVPTTLLNIPAENFLWNEAYAKFTITDVKGLNDPMTMKWNGREIECIPQTEDRSQSLVALLNATSAEDFFNASFSANIDLNGSEQLLFTPVGKTSLINLSGSWKHPSFSGSTLPQTSDVSNSGFKANWKSLAHKRGYPQQWTDNAFRLDYDFSKPGVETESRFSSSGSGRKAVKDINLGSSAFGVDLFIPVSDYQKTMRTVKYAMLCILLTFASFFLIETTQKKPVHPFHYGLVGLALILFYTLLLSISEYTGFNAAYFISSTATIGLVAWFARSILQSSRSTTVLSVVLVLVYAYVFSLLQLSDYSLLLGSIGLFLSLAVIMYFSRKIQW